MASKRAFIPLGGTARARFAGTGISPAAGTQVLQNVIPLIYTENVTGKKALKMVSRNGYSNQLFAQQGSIVVQRGILWTAVSSTVASQFTRVFAGSDGTNVTLYSHTGSSTLTTLGTFAAATYECLGLQETVIGTTPNITLNIRVSGSSTAKALFYPNGGALTEITDGDFPTNTIGEFVHMDGYAFIMDINGNIWNSDLNSISAWTATSFVNANGYPGFGVGLCRIGNLIVAFKGDDVEFYENVGNASGSPLQRLPQYTKRVGAKHASAILRVGESILFVGNSTTSGTGVFMLTGATVTKISSPWIDQIILNAVPVSDSRLSSGFTQTVGCMFLGTAVWHGQQVALLCTPKTSAVSNATNPVYAFVVGTQDTWIKFTTPNTGFAQFSMSGDNFMLACIGFYGDGVYTTLFTDCQNDSIANTPTAYSWKIVTEPITHGTGQNKQYNGIWLHCDQQVTSGNVLLQYSDDDGATFSSGDNLDVSQAIPFINSGLGQSRRRIYQLSSSTVPCLIDGMEVEYEEMPN